MDTDEGFQKSLVRIANSLDRIERSLEKIAINIVSLEEQLIDNIPRKMGFYKVDGGNPGPDGA